MEVTQGTHWTRRKILRVDTDMKDIGLWEYNASDGLYYFEGGGIGCTYEEVQKFEDDVEVRHIMKSRKEW